MSLRIALKFVALSLLSCGAAQAAEIGAFACDGCSPLQEEQKALSRQSRGYLFVYNVAGNRIRKFEIVVFAVDGARISDPAAEKFRAVVGARRIDAIDDVIEAPVAGNETARVGVTRELWEYAVDPQVRQVFETIVSVEARLPGVLAGQRSMEVPIRNIGLTPGSLGPRAHDPREIAWFSGSPQGARYNEFMDRLADQLDDAASTERISRELADVLHGIQGQSSGLSVSVGLTSASVGISWERIKPTVELKLCDDEGNCVTVVVKKEGRYVQVTYKDTRDRQGVSLPSEPSSRVALEWRQNGREAANAYAQWLRSQNRGRIEYVGGSQSGCQLGYILSCVRIEGTTMLACQLHCR